MTTSLLLSSSWDLMVDSSGNIATVSGAYALAQDVACALVTFLGELYYDTTQGVDYPQILGHTEDSGFISAQLKTVALAVPGVMSAQVLLNAPVNGLLSGTVNFTDATGQALGVTFGGQG